MGQAKSRESASCDDNRQRRACTGSTEAPLEKHDTPQTSFGGARQPPFSIQGSSNISRSWYEILAFDFASQKWGDHRLLALSLEECLADQPVRHVYCHYCLYYLDIVG